MTNKEQFLKTHVSTIRRGFSMFENMLKLIDFLEHCGEISRTQLERELGFKVATMLDWLEVYGKVKSTKRAEEMIKADVSGVFFNSMDDIHYNEDGSILCEGRYWQKPYNIYDFTIDRRHYGVIVDGKREVQVVRKYYTWVG